VDEVTTEIDDETMDEEQQQEEIDNPPPQPKPSKAPPPKATGTVIPGTNIALSGVAPAVLADLGRKTPVEEIKQRMAMKKSGQPAYGPDGAPLMLSYVDARYVQDVLDDVVGPANWQSVFQNVEGAGGEGVRAGIGINVNGEWVWKFDAGVPSNIEPVKGAHSDAFKRAAVQWGIARDLYDKADDAADALNAAVAAAPTQTVQQQAGTRYAGQAPQAAAPQGVVTQDDTRTAEEVEQDAMDLGLVWSCPLHGGIPRYTAAGVTKNPPHRPYAARIRCSERNCKENGPFVPVPGDV